MANPTPPGIRIVRPPHVQGGGDPKEKLVPESVKLEIVESPRGTPLQGLIDAFGGYSGTVTDYFGQAIPVSLEKWRSSDPLSVKVFIRLRYANRHGRH